MDVAGDIRTRRIHDGSSVKPPFPSNVVPGKSETAGPLYRDKLEHVLLTARFRRHVEHDRDQIIRLRRSRQAKAVDKLNRGNAGGETGLVELRGSIIHARGGKDDVGDEWVIVGRDEETAVAGESIGHGGAVDKRERRVKPCRCLHKGFQTGDEDAFVVDV